MIDNYDSFVYNLARYFRELNEEVLIKSKRANLFGITAAVSLIGMIITILIK